MEVEEYDIKKILIDASNRNAILLLNTALPNFNKKFVHQIWCKGERNNNLDWY